jgi:hypothetical protein
MTQETKNKTETCSPQKETIRKALGWQRKDSFAYIFSQIRLLIYPDHENIFTLKTAVRTKRHVYTSFR